MRHFLITMAGTLIKRNPLNSYFVIAITFTALCWIPTSIIAYLNGYTLLNNNTFGELIQTGFVDTQHVIISFIFALGVYGPLIASILVLLTTTSRSGVADLFSRMKKWRVDKKYYLAIFLIPFILTVPAIAVALVLGIPLPSPFELVVPLQFIPLFIIYQIFTSGLEEPGWRGYALPELMKTMTAEKASYKLGVIWSIWHWPFLIFVTVSNLPIDIAEAGYMMVAMVSIVQVLLFNVLTMVGMAVIYTWLYNNTESVFICIIFHALSNIISLFLMSLIPAALALIVGILPWVIAMPLLHFYGSETLTGKENILVQ
ncbi:MAG: putative CAAX amino terminal protease self-immunity [Candidatus Thorarchaeota archaeon]|nr:MAG: putative CAAX amino terminal protease self-immunity [Candidatus Thorarchaeota archaeon]